MSEILPYPGRLLASAVPHTAGTQVYMLGGPSAKDNTDNALESPMHTADFIKTQSVPHFRTAAGRRADRKKPE